MSWDDLEMEELEAKIADLTRTNSALEVLVDAKVTKIADLETVLTRRQEDINGQTKKIADLENNLVELELSSTSKIESQEKKIAELEAEISGLVASSLDYQEQITKHSSVRRFYAIEIEKIKPTRIEPANLEVKLKHIAKKLRGKE